MKRFRREGFLSFFANGRYTKFMTFHENITLQRPSSVSAYEGKGKGGERVVSSVHKAAFSRYTLRSCEFNPNSALLMVLANVSYARRWTIAS